MATATALFNDKQAATAHAAKHGGKVIRIFKMTDKTGKKVSTYSVRKEGRSMLSFKQFCEATYQGKKVPLNKPMQGDVKKSKVFVDPDGDGVAQKVNFGDKNMTIKKNIPARRKSFRARHNCDTASDKTTPRYWSCKAW